jgi:NADH-quinone oxidoreductase subunit A
VIIMVWTLALYSAIVVAVVAAILIGSYFLGQRHWDRGTGTPFESGIVPQGSARTRFSAKYYLIAMFFVIFDLEAAFLFAWAVAARNTGWTGYFEALVFIGVLLVGLVYLALAGGLSWAPGARKSR